MERKKEVRKQKALEIGQRAIERKAWTLDTAVEFCQQVEKGRLSDEVLDFFYNVTTNKEIQRKVKPIKVEGKEGNDGKANLKASGNSSRSSR